MKKPKYKDNRKRARDGDQALWIFAIAVNISAGLTILPKKLDTMSNGWEGFAQLTTIAVIVFVVVSFFIKVRATRMGISALLCAMAATALWQIPSGLCENFQEGWGFTFAGVPTLVSTEVLVIFCFVLYIRFLEKKS